jgi:hypothetical protein
MTTWVPFEYRDFYDVPRMIVLRHRGRVFLLDCPFDDISDEYRESYEVFEIGDLSPDALRGSWKDLRAFSKGRLGIVKVDAVRFDATTRKEVDATSIPALGL